jgi:hypothetical protein
VPEKWLPVTGWEGFYEVSDLGRIRSLERRVPMPFSNRPSRRVPAKIMKATSHKGDQTVTLSRNGKNHYPKIHRLVLTAFVGPCPPGMECCHNNGDFTDNRLENLRWGTPSSNLFDLVRHGNHGMSRKTHCKHGHEFTPENTYLYRGGRTCRACDKRRGEEYRARATTGLNSPAH